MSINEQFKNTRIKCNIGIKALSLMTNVQANRIKKFEEGNANITIKTLELLLKTLGTSLQIKNP